MNEAKGLLGVIEDNTRQFATLLKTVEYHMKRWEEGIVSDHDTMVALSPLIGTGRNGARIKRRVSFKDVDDEPVKRATMDLPDKPGF